MYTVYILERLLNFPKISTTRGNIFVLNLIIPMQPKFIEMDRSADDSLSEKCFLFKCTN
jgi:hypothetical protein